MSEHDRIDEFRAAWEPVWPYMRAAALLLTAVAMLSGCAYLDAAHAIKEEGKARAGILNDHYAADVADLARTIPAGALARMPAGERKCALATLVGLRLIECGFIAQPAWAAADR
jgi:hypothetical protein